MIKIITLNSTISIIGYIEYDSLNNIIVRNPWQIMLNINESGENILFIPFLTFTREYSSGILLKESSILCVCSPNWSLEDKYKELIER